MKLIFNKSLLNKYVIFTLAFISLGLSAESQAKQEEKVLNIYNWSDYIGTDTIANFEKETGIKVHYDIFDSSEILHAKLVAKKSGYDIVMTSADLVKQESDGGLIQKLDRKQITNWKNLDPVILAKQEKYDKGNAYSVGWMWGYTTVGINVDKVKKALGTTPMPDNAWDLVLNPKYTSKLKSCGISFVDAPTEIFPLTLHHLGKQPFSTIAADYKAAFDVLMKVRPDIKKFDSAGQLEDLATGSVCVVFGWVGNINNARNRSIENKSPQNIEALVPKTGGLMFMDTMAIPIDAPHVSNAHKFINYILRPEVHAGITNTVTYANPNKAATPFVSKEIKNNKSIYLSDADMANLIPPSNIDDKNIRRVRTRFYTQFKTGI